MDRICIETLYDVAEMMYERIIETDAESVAFIGFYEDAAEIIKNLILLDDTGLYQVTLEPEEWDGYDKEYLVTLDRDLNIWCEKAWRETYYVETGDDCTYIMGDCNAQMLPKIGSDEIYELTFDYDEYDCANCDCDECCHCGDKEDESSTTVTRVAVDDKGTVRGFEKSWSTVNGNTTYHTTYTHYSNDTEMLKKLMENFDVKYIK